MYPDAGECGHQDAITGNDTADELLPGTRE